jgi:uncharacterized protein (UPF0335 family)
VSYFEEQKLELKLQRIRTLSALQEVQTEQLNKFASWVEVLDAEDNDNHTPIKDYFKTEIRRLKSLIATRESDIERIQHEP